TWTGSPSRLSKGTPVGEMAMVPMSRSTLPCLVWGMATPRPMPVEPSPSRFMMARMTSSTSEPRNWLAVRRLSTISRMTASLEEAVRCGTMASRTTNSDMRMSGTPSLFRRLLPCGRAYLADGRGPAVILDALLVAAQLLLDLVQGQVHGGEQFAVGLAGNEVVLVLGLDDELHVLAVLAEIDGDLDHGQPLEVVEQFLSFLPDVVLCVFVQVAVASGDLDLHGPYSLLGRCG